MNITSAVKTVTTAKIAAGQAKNIGGNRIVAKQQDGPLYRPHKLLTAAAPAHRLGNWQGGQRLVDDVPQEGFGIAAGNALANTELVLLAIVFNQLSQC